jgi:hypothetical protein
MMEARMRPQAYEEYEGDWGAVLARAQALVADGERSLPRMLSLLNRPPERNPNAKLLRLFGHRIAGKRVRGIRDPAYEPILFERAVQRELGRAIDPDTRVIIELGSGYSRNLFRIWLNGGLRDARYIGMEYTSAGRECGAFLATLETAIRYESLEFDYYKPSLPTIGSEKTFVFTCYSIEQITHLDQRIFDALLALPGLYKVMHIEPVGWQKGPRLMPFPVEAMLWLSTRVSAYRTGYNTNLVKVLQSLERAGRIVQFEPPKINYLAHRPNLPGSIFTWAPGK